MTKNSSLGSRCFMASIFAFCLLPIVAPYGNAQIRLSPEALTREQEYLLGSYGLYDKDGVHLILENDSLQSLTVIVVLQGEGIDIDSAKYTAQLTSKSSRIHLGLSQGFMAADPYPTESYELYPYVYDDQSIQSTWLSIGDYRYPKIEWKVAVQKGDQIALGSSVVVGELTVRPQFDPNPPSPEELSLMSGPPSPNLEPFHIKCFVTIARSK